MAYYGQPSMNRGDYYRGDYYRGDPGVFGFLKKVGKGIFGAAKGFLTGGLPGAISGAGSAVYGGELEAAGPRGLTEGELAALHTRDARLRALRANQIAGAGGVMPGGSLPPGAPGMAIAALPGMSLTHRRQHPNRSTYVTRGGGTSRWPVALTVHPKGTELVTSRRMNVGNGRALRRALRRARGFAKLAHKVLRVTRQFKGKGFGRGVRRRK